MNTALASGTWTMTSPFVWAGPTSISSTSRPPTSTLSRPSNVRVGGVSVIPSNVKSPKKLRNSSPTSPGATLRPASIAGATSPISSAHAVEAMISAPATSSLP